MALNRPDPSEYNPYFQHYLDLVPDGDFDSLFKAHTDDLVKVFRSIPAEKEDFAYAEGKWSVKQMLQHITDTDRCFSYRAFVAARKDLKTTLFSMDENQYSLSADVSNRSLSEIADEFEAVRNSFYLLVKNLDEDKSSAKAFVESHPVTARAMAWIAIGHGMHHLAVLRERYISRF